MIKTIRRFPVVMLLLVAITIFVSGVSCASLEDDVVGIEIYKILQEGKNVYFMGFEEKEPWEIYGTPHTWGTPVTWQSRRTNEDSYQGKYSFKVLSLMPTETDTAFNIATSYTPGFTEEDRIQGELKAGANYLISAQIKMIRIDKGTDLSFWLRMRHPSASPSGAGGDRYPFRWSWAPGDLKKWTKVEASLIGAPKDILFYYFDFKTVDDTVKSHMEFFVDDITIQEVELGKVDSFKKTDSVTINISKAGKYLVATRDEKGKQLRSYTRHFEPGVYEISWNDLLHFPGESK